LALHPAYRWDLFDETWADKPEWIAKAKSIVHDVWITEYAHLDLQNHGLSGDEDSPPAKRPRFYNPFAANSRTFQPSRSIAVLGDEYEAWQRDKEGSDHEVRNPISYWVAKQDRYH
jgi:hypothetical protein